MRRRLNVDLVNQFANHPSVFILDADDVVTRFGARRSRDSARYYQSHIPFAVEIMPGLADAFACVVAPLFIAPRKCVVVDCDDTLWGGVLGEDGPDGVSLGPDYPGTLYRQFHLYLRGLKNQGTLLAINSKNNEKDVLAFLSTSPGTVLRPGDFVAMRINWSNKASNLRELAAEMSIGFDSIVYVDDSEVECELIRTLLPEVQVEVFPSAPTDIPAFIERLSGLDVLRVTDDDRKRAASMMSAVERERLRAASVDLDGFIRSLEIRLLIRCQPTDLVGRVSQLTQRTNQFNLTTRRYTEAEVRALMADGVIYTLAMADRFSDYGTVGAAIVRLDGDRAEIDTLLLSCRAFGRDVEHEFVRRMLDDLARRGVREVVGSYLKSAKNEMVRDFYARCGFERGAAADGAQSFRLDLSGRAVDRADSRYHVETDGLE